jgi:ligand-binding sensor domain-containing protein
MDKTQLLKKPLKLKLILTLVVIFTSIYLIGAGFKALYSVKALQTSAMTLANINNSSLKLSKGSEKPSKIKALNSIQLPFTQLFETGRVNDMETDLDGNLWVATENGITSISSDRNTIKHYSLKDGTFPFAQASSLAFDGKTLWVGSLFGLCKLSKSKLFVTAEESSLLPSEIIWDLYWDKNTLWISTQKGVAFITNNGEPQTLNHESTNKALKNDWCKGIAKIKHWFIVSHDSGISLWNTSYPASNPDIWRNISIETTNLPRSINALAVDESYLWLATSNGLFQLSVPVEKFFNESLNKFSSLTKLNGLASNNINSIIHHKDAIWAGTSEGLAQIKNGRVQMVYPSFGEFYKEIRKLHAMGDILWLGTENGVQFINTAMVGQDK